MAHRVPNAGEKNLSIALIAGAFSFIGLAIFASASFADKVSMGALLVGNLLGTAAVFTLLLSIVFGGKGMSKVGTGPWNAFDLQAWAGLLGVGVLTLAAGIFAFNPKPEAPKVDAATLEAHFHRLEIEQRKLESEVSRLRDQLRRSPEIRPIPHTSRKTCAMQPPSGSTK